MAVHHNQRGLSVVAVVLVVVAVGAIGLGGWFVSQASKGGSSSDQTSVTFGPSERKTTADTSTSDTDINIEKTTLSKATPSLQAAVLAEYKLSASACVKDDKIVSMSGSAIDPEITVLTGKFAEVNVHCDSGAATLFAKAAGRSNHSWTKVGSTQMRYKCSDLKKYQVPVSFLQAVADDKTADIQCLPDDSPNAVPVKYEG